MDVLNLDEHRNTAAEPATMVDERKNSTVVKRTDRDGLLKDRVHLASLRFKESVTSLWGCRREGCVHNTFSGSPVVA